MLAVGMARGENAPVKARYVRVESGRATNYLHFAEVEVYVGGKNIAVKKPVKASSTMGSFTPEKAADGVIEYTFGKDASFWSSARDKGGEWWELDLGAEVPVEKLVLYNRLDCCQERLEGALLSLLSDGRSPMWQGVLHTQNNPVETVFFEREEPPVNLRARSLAERMAEVAPRFAAPSDDPADVMPVGTGDLSAMLRYGDAYEIHLSKSDFFAVEKYPYHKSPTQHSPGHVQLSFGIPKTAIRRFSERLDTQRGSVVLEIETADGRVKAETFGLMERNVLVVAVEDTRAVAQVSATISCWRPEMDAAVAGNRVIAREVHDYDEGGKPVAAGAQGNPQDRMYRLGIGTVVGFVNASGVFPTIAEAGKSAVLRLAKPGASYWLVIASATSYDGHPETVAQAAFESVAKGDKGELLAAHLAWWKRFWQASSLDLYGKDAERLMGLWYTGYYSYASVANATVPPKFNGGPGLVCGDERSWGWGYWWQNTRELIWPMFAANRLGYARDYLDFYDRRFAEGQRGTAHQGKLGIRLGEGETPFKPGTVIPPKVASVFDAAALEKAASDLTLEKVKSGYNARSMAQSVELTQLMFDYVAYTGDAEYLKSTAAPWLKEAALFYLSALRTGDDSRYHSMVSDAAEMWWKIKDSSVDLAAARYCFWMVVNHGAAFGYEPAFIDAVRGRVDRLAPLPTGAWKRHRATAAELPPGESPGAWIVDAIDRATDVYAPAGDLYDDRVAHNQENPELYSVFPFAVVDALSPAAEYARAVNTFRARNYPNSAGWSQCPVQAARLRLDDTVDVIMDHVRRHQKYPYGGWNSPAQRLEGSKSGATDTPYFDTAGVNLTALQETLLQSHVPTTSDQTDLFCGGVITLMPAVRKDWAGRFKLLARGGFLVGVEFQRKRTLVKAVIESERGGTLRLANPCGACRVSKEGKAVLTSKDAVIEVPTQAGDVLVFEPLTGLQSLDMGGGGR